MLYVSVWLFATLWTVACQVPLSMGFSRQEYWSGLPFCSPGDVMDPGIESGSPAWQAGSSPPNRKEYQIVRTHTKETTWTQDPASPHHQQQAVQDASSKQQTKQEYKPIISRQDYRLSQPCPSEGKKKTQLKSHSIRSLHKPLHQSFFKRKKESNLEAWVKETSNTVS